MTVTGRVLVWVLLGVLVGAAAALGWALWQYQQLSDATEGARARLPKAISSDLVDAGPIADEPQVTLVRGYGELATGNVILFRSDPGSHQLSFLTIPRHLVSQLPDETRGPATVSELIVELQNTVDISINHVALVNFAGIREIVDSLGGVTVRNRAPFLADAPSVQNGLIQFPRGLIELDGDLAVAYLSGILPALRPAHEAQVLQAVIDATLEPADIADVTGRISAIADSAETDYTADDLLGLVAVRLQTAESVTCDMTSATSSAEAQRAIDVFAAKADTAPACRERAVEEIPTGAVLSVGAAAVSHWGRWPLVAGLVAVLAALAAVLWRYRLLPAPLPLVDEIRSRVGQSVAECKACTSRAVGSGGLRLAGVRDTLDRVRETVADTWHWSGRAADRSSRRLDGVRDTLDRGRETLAETSQWPGHTADRWGRKLECRRHGHIWDNRLLITDDGRYVESLCRRCGRRTRTQQRDAPPSR